MPSSDRLIQVLRSRPNIPAGELLAVLGVSRATLMRQVRAAGAEVLTLGRARRTAYAARRPLRGSTASLPVFQIDEQGGSEQVAGLDLAYPDGSVVTFHGPSRWPLDASMRDGWFEGLPYFLQDLRPDGFLGRRFARAYGHVLQIGNDPRLWTDDEALHALSLLGADSTGNLIVGEGAFRIWLDQIPNSFCLEEGRVADAYVEQARLALQDGYAGSSAAGEFPKFTALRRLAGPPEHVLVKFSGADASPGSQRWSDLLICEHLAAQTIVALPGLAAARTRVLQAGNRTFLEVVRFDRHGEHGRSALCSWAAFNYAWFGLAGRPWPEGAAKLLERGLIDFETAQAITRLWHFGSLIGNTDMHDHNLSFMPRPASLELAPAYDMLPMFYAPQRGTELSPRSFVPRRPLPAERSAWQDAATAAQQFWSKAAEDERISPEFRQICAVNRDAVRRVAGHPA